MLARTRRSSRSQAAALISGPHFVRSWPFLRVAFVTFVVLSCLQSCRTQKVILSHHRRPARPRAPSPLHSRQPARLDHPIPRPRLPVIARLLRMLPQRQRQHQISSRSRARTAHTSTATSPASPARIHRSATAAPPPPAQPATPRTPPPATGPAASRIVPRIHHLRQIHCRMPRHRKRQLRLPRMHSLNPGQHQRRHIQHRRQRRQPRLVADAATERTSAPDTKSATPATPPPIAPSRAALHRGHSDPSPDPPSSPPAAPATPPPTEAIPPAHPASKSESLAARTTNTPPG